MSTPKKNIDPAVSAAAASLGRSGGKNGTGDAKRRDKQHYEMLTESRRKAAMIRKLKGEA